MKRRVMQKTLKRALDRAAAALLLCLFSPVLLLLTLLVRWRMGHPAIFRQRRPGLDGKPFTMFKFRTMTDERGPDGNLLPDERRLTALGQWLRATSLDELPELFNVLRGEMSLVGPRPLLMQYLDRYTPHQARRMEVLPGITGWAQIHGRNSVSWSDRLSLDVWYVDHWSLWLDLRILALTLGTVLRRDGIAAAAHATMPEFAPSSLQHSDGS